MTDKEQKRRRRELVIIFITILVIVILTIVENHVAKLSNLIPVSNDALIFGLINVNIILIILLLFLIIRNMVKLIFERKHGIMGSKLRTKLVAAFVSLSLIPTIVLFVVAINFLSYSIDNWFSIKVGGALNLSLDVARTFYSQYTDNAKYHAAQISEVVSENRLYEESRTGYLKTLFEQRLKGLKLELIEASFKQRDKISIFDANKPKIEAPAPSPKELEEIFSGKGISSVHTTGPGDIISAFMPVHNPVAKDEILGYVSVSYFIPGDMVTKMSIISKTSEEYKQFRVLKNPIKLSYIITLSLVTLLIIFSATWFGLFLAKGITVPIQDLAEATKKIALGDLEHQISIKAADEIGVLVNSFNQMTRNLKISKSNLEQANIDLERRRKYMETVLSNVSAGVVSIDQDGCISTVNRAAEKILSVPAHKVLNRKYLDVINPRHLEILNDSLREMEETGESSVEKQILLKSGDKTLTIWSTATVLKDDENNNMGMVFVFEDLTQLQKAERMAAWREVARRIAHEIKNPLTPVQLSAQRLRKKYGERLKEDNSIFEECTKTIIDQVDVLKNLVDEFSRFARMPVTNPSPNDLNEVVQGSLTLFQDAHKDIAFKFDRADDLPLVNLDPEQIRRVMINLLDNACAAVDNKSGLIEIRTLYEPGSEMVKVEVADNGCGIPAWNRMRMFEPYFSTKKKGTGLGLAIVSSIISDHNGNISVRDNTPRGTVISFELPVKEAA